MNYDNLVASVTEQSAAQFEAAKNKRVSPVPGRIAHIDGDFLAYFASGKAGTPAGHVRRNIDSRVARVMRTTGATKVIMHLTCPSSDKGKRYLVAETREYQKQRKGTKPANWQVCRDYMTTHDGSQYTPKIWRDREADDGMAYVTFATYEKHGLHVIHAKDKDMRMFPGIHLNWDTWQQTIVPYGAYDVVGEDGLQYGHKWFWYQMIVGDTADHIPGLPNHGPAAADVALADTTDNTEAYAAVAALYQRCKGEGWADYMVEQAALLWMRLDRHADIGDFLRLDVFPDEVVEAAQRMYDRVQAHLEKLEALRA